MWQCGAAVWQIQPMWNLTKKGVEKAFVWLFSLQKAFSYLVPNDLNAVTGEESDLKATLSSPPDWLLRTRHVNHRDHVPHLQKWDFRYMYKNMIQKKVNITLTILYEHEHGTPGMCFQGNCSHICPSGKYTDVVLYCYAMLQNGSTVFPSFAHGLKGGGSVMTVISISTLLVPVGSTIENCQWGQSVPVFSQTSFSAPGNSVILACSTYKSHIRQDTNLFESFKVVLWMWRKGWQYDCQSHHMTLVQREV